MATWYSEVISKYFQIHTTFMNMPIYMFGYITRLTSVSLFYARNLTLWSNIMKPLCPNCFSSHVVPVTTANPNFPQSLDPALLSPAVLASVGASLCKQTTVPSMVGTILGTIIGIALSNLGNHQTACHSYYCRNCKQVFDTDDRTLSQPVMDTACPTQLVSSN